MQLRHGGWRERANYLSKLETPQNRQSTAGIIQNLKPINQQKAHIYHSVRL